MAFLVVASSAALLGRSRGRWTELRGWEGTPSLALVVVSDGVADRCTAPGRSRAVGRGQLRAAPSELVWITGNSASMSVLFMLLNRLVMKLKAVEVTMSTMSASL